MSPARHQRSRLGVLAIAVLVGAASFVVVGAQPVVAASNPIVAENLLTGSTGWKIPASGYRLSADTPGRGQIKGYASATSVNKGGSISFKISVYPAQNYTINVYRLGWYGGAGGRRMLSVASRPGTTQSTCPGNANGTIQCSWSTSYTLTVPTTWTSGIYVAVLTNSNAYQNDIIFTVRDDSRVAQLLYQQPVTTYQAYNNYPNDGATGKSLYDYNSYGATTTSGGVRASKVSFDRPYSGNGAGDFFNHETDMLTWLERSGYDVAYATDVDAHQAGSRLQNYLGVVSVGHDEYWSKQMYDAFENARDAGVGLSFFGANGVYWQIRFETGGGVQNRVIACYKSKTADPNPDASLKTSQWRTVGRPEQALMGIQYTHIIQGSSDYVVTNAGHWIYRNTGFRDGDKVADIVGYEGDRFMSEYPAPVARSYDLLSHSPYTTNEGGSDYTNSSIYQAPSRAWVFAVGSLHWTRALGRAGYTDGRIQQMTANALAALTDRQGPSLTAPSVALVTGAADPTTVPAKVSWNGTDATYIESFVLEQSMDGGAFAEVWSGLGTSLDVQIAPGHTYRFRVKAVDANLNWSGYQTGSTYKLDAVEESSPSIAYSGSWTSVSDATASGGAYEMTSATGSSATYAISGASLAWMAQKGPSGGPVAVYVDRKLVTTVDLHAATAEPRQVLVRLGWGGKKTHTVEFRFVGSGGSEGYLDALLVLR